MIRATDGALCYLSARNHEVFNTNRKSSGPRTGVQRVHDVARRVETL